MHFENMRPAAPADQRASLPLLALQPFKHMLIVIGTAAQAPAALCAPPSESMCCLLVRGLCAAAGAGATGLLVLWLMSKGQVPERVTLPTLPPRLLLRDPLGALFHSATALSW